MNTIRPAITVFIALTIVTGIAYPLAITAIAQTFFASKASGSIIKRDGKPIGSPLIGQEFGTSAAAAAPALAKWFWGRPSATSPAPYTALNLAKGTGSSGSNLAPTNSALLDNIKARIAALRAAEASVGITQNASAIPIDLVTTSASGLDPHISIAAAEYQIPRVARARSISEPRLREIMQAHTTARTLGVLGEPVVNILELNLALEAETSTSRDQAGSR